MKIRLNKYIADAGIASRRKADKLISAGEVTINGTVCMELGTKVDSEADHVKVKGKLIQPSTSKVYILMNKPKGYVTTTDDPEGRDTVLDILRNVQGRVFPVGRLDLQTEGLLLITNDGEFANNIMKPSNKVRKIYHAKIRGTINENLKKKLQYGISVDGETLKLDKVKILKEDKNSWLEITLREGKNRQIRRIFDAVNHPVVKLRRVQIGYLKAPRLAPGDYTFLNDEQVKRIFERRKK